MEVSAADQKYFAKQGTSRYRSLSDIEHARLKSSDTGSPVPAPLWGLWVTFNADGTHKVTLGEEVMSEKLFTAVREPFVNITDIVTAMDGIRNVRIAVDGAEVTIENDGGGMPVAKDADGTWIPQNCFGKFKSGGNVKRAVGTLLGGTNGLGVKLTNALSERMEARVTDGKQVFEMTWEPMETPSAPTVRPRKRGEPLGVRLAFRLCGKYFDGASAASMRVMVRLCVHTLAANLAAYVAPRGVKVFLRDAKFGAGTEFRRLEVGSLKDLLMPLAKGADGWEFATATVAFPQPARGPHAGGAPLAPQKWEVLLAEAGGDAAPLANDFTIVNGTATHKGPHILAIKQAVREHLNARLKRNALFRTAGEAEVTMRKLAGHLTVAAITRIPDADWSDQCKTVLRFPQKYEVNIPKPALARICAKIEDRLRGRLSQARDTKELTGAISLRMDKKHKSARLAGKRDWRDTVLIVLEGDSALNTAVRVFIAGTQLKRRPYWMRSDYCGFYNLGGVIMNAWKEAQDTGNDVIMSERMKQNLPLRGLIELLKGKQYGHIVFATDADIDGEMIKCQLLSFYQRMLKANGISGEALNLYMWSTPMARGFQGKGKRQVVTNFYVEEDSENTPEGMKVSYYKGLAALEQTRDQLLVNDIQQRLIPFAVNDRREFARLCDVWFEKESAPRKRAIEEDANPARAARLWRALRQADAARPPGKPSRVSTAAPIPAEDFIGTYMRAGSVEKNRRTMKHVLDGLLEATRKSVFAMFYMSKPTEGMQIYIRGGEVTSLGGYAHGDASLFNLLKGMGMYYLGGGTMPFARLLGQPPARAKGIKEGGAARYVKMKPNLALLRAVFRPAESAPFLANTHAYGEDWEPVNYVPVVPYAVMDYHEGLGTGWRQKLMARDPLATASAVIRMIVACDPARPEAVPYCPYIAPHTAGFDGKFWRSASPFRSSPLLLRGEERRGEEQRGEGQAGAERKETPRDALGRRCVEWFEGRWTYCARTGTLTIHDIPYFTSKGPQKSETYVAGLARLCAEYRWEMNGRDTVMNNIAITVAIPSDEFRQIERLPGGVPVFFKLRDSHECAELCMIAPQLGELSATPRDECVTFPHYPAMVEFWFPAARRLCCARWRRDVPLTEERLRLAEAKLRFTQIYDAVGIEGGMRVAQMEERLERQGFVPINEAFLKTPGKVVEEAAIRREARGAPNASYRYLLRMSCYDRTEEAQRALRSRIAQLVTELRYLRSDTFPFLGAARWLREVKHFRDVYEEGLRTDFLYEDWVAP
jgi:DNA gyrase/topoisomerase IV subunit B